MPRLRVELPLSSDAQPIEDSNGVLSSVYLSTGSFGIKRAVPEGALDVGGDVKVEYSGSPKITLYSRGNGTQKYSIRATNDEDPAGGRLLAFRNESAQRDDLVLDSAGNLKLEHDGSPQITLYSRGYGTQEYSIRATNNDDTAGGRLLVFRNESHQRDDMVLDNAGNLKLEHSGSPKITLYSRGNGTQQFSIRATNDADPAEGRKFVVRNESQGEDVFTIDAYGGIKVAGDITLPGADCAERFTVADSHVEPGTVMVIDTDETLRESSEPYDRRVAGVISGAASRRPGFVLGGEGGDQSRQPLALGGTVYCKVDATAGSVEVGDLLVTATSPGYAMKATDRDRAFGAVIGKALRGLPDGFDLIPILVSLQ